MEKGLYKRLLFNSSIIPVCWVSDADYDLDIGNDVPNVISTSVFWFRECFVFLEVKPVVVLPKNRCACFSCKKKKTQFLKPSFLTSIVSGESIMSLGI